MGTVSLVIVIHDHQPVGNFDSVFARALARAYRPFLELLERHSSLRLALHTSGPLLEWLAAHEADYLLRLRVLVEKGQIELWGGAFFEPILPAIPEADRQGQIRSMTHWLDLHFGQRPRGMWVAERVWEPALAATLADAGVEYTALDDAHFLAAGLERDELFGHFWTEDEGKRVAVFPIQRELRYLVPFRPVGELMTWLAGVAREHEGGMVLLGDDGEKFGIWPGTHERCYEEGYLDQLAQAIADADFVQLLTPSEAFARLPSRGLVYLPSASYHEMEEWSLTPSGQRRYQEAAELLRPRLGDAAADLLRGGHWRNFLRRYPEANRTHKRMLRVSERLWARPRPREPRWQQARTHLWRAQCNCPYWHGVFGGLYLPHLRGAVVRELIAAESALCGSGPHNEVWDLDLDGAPEVLLESESLAAWVAPALGGALFGLDDRVRLHGYGDTLARRPELYHAGLAEAPIGGGQGETIHSAVRMKESGLAALLQYDDTPRFSFLDRFAPSPGGDLHPLSAGRAYQIVRRAGAELELRCEPEAGSPALRIEKSYALQGSGWDLLRVRYRLTNAGDARVAGTFSVECNWALQVPLDHQRIVAIDGVPADPPHFAAHGEHPSCRRVTFLDQWAGRRLEVRWSVPGALRRAPVETVSRSESGVERVFQATETLVSWPLHLMPGADWELEFEVEAGSSAPAPAP